MLQQTCAVVYAIILAQRMAERYGEIQRERNPTAQVRHQHQNKRKHLGIFHTAEEAALCYARYMRDTGR